MVLKKQIILPIDVDNTFQFFTKDSLLEKWLTVKANVEPYEGGLYELFWDPEKPEEDSTHGCKIFAYEKYEFLGFEWKGPVQFSDIMNHCEPLTSVCIIFNSEGIHTKVSLFHLGWRFSDQWKGAYDFFDKAWDVAFGNLSKIIAENRTKFL